MSAPGSHRVTVAVLGAGVVGRTLATGWARAGHRVVVGSRSPGSDRIRAAVTEIGGDTAAAVHAEAARGADAVVVAVPGDQINALLGEVGDALVGRVTIDTTNTLTPGAQTMHNADTLAAAGARVFRALNSVGWEQMARPVFGGTRSDMPYAGPEGPDRALVHDLIDSLGFRAVWLGAEPEALALTDDLGRLWFQLVFQRGWGRRLGLRLLTAEDDTAEQTDHQEHP